MDVIYTANKKDETGDDDGIDGRTASMDTHLSTLEDDEVGFDSGDEDELSMRLKSESEGSRHLLRRS